MEKKRDIKNNGFMPQKGNPLHETVTYKIGGTIFEVSTICGSSEPLYSKMERLIKSATIPRVSLRSVIFAISQSTTE